MTTMVFISTDSSDPAHKSHEQRTLDSQAKIQSIFYGSVHVDERCTAASSFVVLCLSSALRSVNDLVKHHGLAPPLAVRQPMPSLYEADCPAASATSCRGGGQWLADSEHLGTLF